MNLQLYMVDSINYLVDFHHKKTYRVPMEPASAAAPPTVGLDYDKGIM